MNADTTNWDLISEAARGDGEARSVFGALYLPVVRAYLTARWAGSPLTAELDDAVQEFFVECFRENGVLTRSRARGAEVQSFRAFLHGVAKNIAWRVEKRCSARHRREGRESLHPSRLASNDDPFAVVFDRAWAKSIMRQAADLMRAKAKVLGATAVRRVELLQLRFYEGKPIREIAAAWDTEPTRLYREYDRARREFRASLREIVGLHHQCPPERLEVECDRLLDLLGPENK